MSKANRLLRRAAEEYQAHVMAHGVPESESKRQDDGHNKIWITVSLMKDINEHVELISTPPEKGS